MADDAPLPKVVSPPLLFSRAQRFISPSSGCHVITVVRVLSAESRAVPVPIHASLSRKYRDFLNRNTFRFLAGCRPVAQSSLGRTPHPFDVITVVRVFSAESREVPVPNHESLSRNMETFVTGTPFASWRGVSPSHSRRWGERTHPFYPQRHQKCVRKPALPFRCHE